MARISPARRRRELARLRRREQRARGELERVDALSPRASELHRELHTVTLERWRIDPLGVQARTRPPPINREAVAFMREKKIATEVNAIARDMYQRQGGRAWSGLPPAQRERWRRQARRDVWGEQHRHVFSVAGLWRSDLLTDIRAAVDGALERGETFSTFRKNLQPSLTAAGWGPTGARLSTIYQTNLRVARSAGHWKRAIRTSRALPFFLYNAGPSASHDRSPEADHVPMFGTVRPIGEWGGRVPPNGYGCKCWLRQIGRGEARSRGLATGDLPPVTTEWDYNPGDPASVAPRTVK